LKISVSTVLLSLKVAGGTTASNVSFAYFKAFNQLLGNLDLIEKIITGAADGNASKEITSGEYIYIYKP